MKKDALLLLLSFLFGYSSIAQTSKSEHGLYITTGIGLYSSNLLMPTTFYHYIPKGNINAGIKYQFSKRFSAGISGGYFTQEKTYATPLAVDQWGAYQVDHKEYRETWWTAAEVSIIYANLGRTSIVLYGSAGAGITHTTGYNESNVLYNQPVFICRVGYYTPQIDENRLTANVTPLGIRGGRKLLWYAEAGYGYKGIFNAGLGYKL